MKNVLKNVWSFIEVIIVVYVIFVTSCILYSALYTLNDNDKSSVSSSRVIGKYVSVKKGAGRALEVLESRFGFLFLVLLPIMIVFIYQVYQLVVVARYEVVDDEDDDKKKIKKKEEKKEVKEKTKEVKKVEKDDDVEFL